MKLSFASGTSGACAPTRFSVLVRDEAAYKTLNFERLPDPSAGATGGYRLSLIPNSHDETVQIGAPAPCGCQNQNPHQNQNRLADWAPLSYNCFWLTRSACLRCSGNGRSHAVSG